jgi:hypothetical protein
MDIFKKIEKIESDEKNEESSIVKEEEKEINITNEIQNEIKSVLSIKDDYFFKNITELEQSFLNILNDFKKNNGMIDSSMEVSDFKKKVSELIVILSDLEKNRLIIKEHIKKALLDDEILYDSLNQKFSFENLDISKKEKEKKLNLYLVKSEEIHSFMKNNLSLGSLESDFSKKLDVIFNQEKDLSILKKDALDEKNIVKAIMVDLRELLKCISNEEFLFEKIAKIIEKNKFLDIKKMPSKKSINSFIENFDYLRKIMAIEVNILDSIPEHICDLKKDEILDEQDLKFLEGISNNSDFFN